MLYVEDDTSESTYVLNHHSGDFPSSVCQRSQLQKDLYALTSALVKNDENLKRGHFHLVVPSLQLYCQIKSGERTVVQRLLTRYSFTLHLVDRSDDFLPNILTGMDIQEIFNSFKSS